MTITVSTLLDRAVRPLGELQAGQAFDADTLAMLANHGMEWLNAMAGHFTGTVGALYDLAVTEAVELAAGNVRLTCTESCTVTAPLNPQDGWRIVAAFVGSGQTLTLDPNGRKINGSTSNATVAAAAVDDFFFRADINDWIDSRVTATSATVPYPDDCLAHLGAMLALELQPILGLPIKFETRMAAAAGERAMVQRYFRKHPDLFDAWRYQAAPRPAAATPAAT